MADRPALPARPAPFDAAAYVAECRRRLPELADEMADAGDGWEAMTWALASWIAEAEWEPDWPVVFRVLDVWEAALAHPGATDEVRIAAQVGPLTARVWERRYGPAAAARAGTDYRPHLDGRAAHAHTRSLLARPEDGGVDAG